jgi:hypothetical protein
MIEATMPTSPRRNRPPDRVDASASSPILAVSCRDLAIRCHFLAAIVPLLPPITRNVKFAVAANRLEFQI